MLVSFIAQHWRGELSLARSYWVNCVLLSIPLNVGARMLGRYLDEVDLSPNAALATSVAFICVFGLVGTWQFVGVWRSANRAMAGGSGRFWPNVAKVVVVLGFVSGAGQIVTSFSDITRLHRALTSMEDADYVLHRFGSDILLFEGVVTTRAAEDLIVLLADEKLEVLMVNSPGGLIVPAYELALAIRERGIAVIATDVCTSACILLLAGGLRAAVMPDSEITFHRPESLIDFTNPTMRDSHEAAMADARDLFRKLGVADWAVDIASAQDFWSPTLRQQIDMGLITHIFDPTDGAFWIATEFCNRPAIVCDR